MHQSLRHGEFETWAGQAIKAIRQLRDLEAWGQWIVDNRELLGRCEQHNPEAWADIRTALDVQSERFPK